MSSPIPHVSQIIREAGLATMDVAQFYLDRGGAFHLATALHDHGTLDETTVDSIILPQLDAYKAWVEELKVEIQEIEVPCYYPSHQFPIYCGTPDRRVVIGGREGLLDLKLGAWAPWHGVQLAAYAEATSPRLVRWNLYLRVDGPGDSVAVRLVEHTDFQDFLTWRAALQIFNHRIAHKLTRVEER